jgi:starch phosphorylase
VIPEFYSRDDDAIPRTWVARVRESMASLTPTYSANRSVRDYVEECYVPAADGYRARAKNGGTAGMEITSWRHQLTKEWPTLRLGRLGITAWDGRLEFTIEVSLGMVDPQAVTVELYAGPRGGRNSVRVSLKRANGDADCEGRALYSASVPADRPSNDYTVRIVPFQPWGQRAVGKWPGALATIRVRQSHAGLLICAA